MSTIRIVAGKYKGRAIPFNTKKYSNADITTQKVKEALFSIIGDLPGRAFVDLFGGSGQIALEALSRGASPVVCNEKDRDRFRFITSAVESLPEKHDIILLNMPASQALRLIAKRGIRPDYIFLDPPYIKEGSGVHLYRGILDDIEKQGDSLSGGTVIIQHFHKNVLPEMMGAFRKTREKEYGSTTLTFYKNVINITE